MLKMLSNLVYKYIKFRLLWNSKKDIMYTHILSFNKLNNYIKPRLLIEGYYLTEYFPFVYLVHPILYQRM